MKHFECNCGFVARAQTSDKIISLMKEHVKIEHPGTLDTTSEKELVSVLKNNVHSLL